MTPDTHDRRGPITARRILKGGHLLPDRTGIVRFTASTRASRGLRGRPGQDLGPGSKPAPVAHAASTSGLTLSTAARGVTITYGTATADLSASALSLGTEPQGAVATEQTATVTNHGDASLIVAGVRTGGADPGDYLVSDRCQQPAAPALIISTGRGRGRKVLLTYRFQLR